jgi:hypothetical protein
MSYDIYGEPLRRGHCEVHPHVHEEYPCSVCIQESNNRNSQQQSECDRYNIASLEHGLELSQQRIADLELQVRSIALSRDHLAATVERLRDLLTIAFEQSEEVEEFLLASGGRNHHLIAEQINEWSKDTEAALSETPQQNLAENDAEVVSKFVCGLVELGAVEASRKLGQIRSAITKAGEHLLKGGE